MIDPNFVYLAILLNFIGGSSYVVQTIRGKAKPNRVTWFLWGVIPLIAFFAERGEGVGIQSLMTFMVGFIPIMVFIASFFNKNSQWKLTQLDFLCGALSIIGVILWIITKDANIAIILCIIADFLAGIPTLIKSYKAPETEHYFAYLSGAISAGITMLTITIWNTSHAAFPVYILIFNTILFSLIRFQLGKRFTK